MKQKNIFVEMEVREFINFKNKYGLKPKNIKTVAVIVVSGQKLGALKRKSKEVLK